MALSVECPAEWDLAFLGADRLDVPRRRAEVMAVGAPAKAPPSLAAPSPARRRGANRYRPASSSAVFSIHSLWTAVTASVWGKLCRPPMPSSEPGRMLELAPFPGFIE